ncbi:MAG: [NiFe]-hydrogenase assembly chaperone HybE [Halieaceae bacterium]|jgi:[NiFe] hydrogenase assembly HybE family chaperone|nr:[NiFe]-hydrogenase assembly chaperone HybE [Halieaceae bacterium]
MQLVNGSFVAHGAGFNEATRFECGICWWVYDPHRGDDVWQIPPGTSFSELPRHWRCPSCDASLAQFMALDDTERVRLRDDARARRQTELACLRERLFDAHRRLASRLQALPGYNHALRVAVPALRDSAHGPVAVLTTPWSMNLLLFSEDAEQLRKGSVRKHVFPSGSYHLTADYLDGVGHFESCAVFPSMEGFDEQRTAVAIALETMAALFRTDEREHSTRPRIDRVRHGFAGAAASR